MRQLLPALLISFVFSACSLVMPAKIPVDIPTAPQLMACPEKPVIEGTIRGDEVVLKLTDAELLSAWTIRYKTCMETNVALLSAHATKLTNRLNALRSN